MKKAFATLLVVMGGALLAGAPAWAGPTAPSVACSTLNGVLTITVTNGTTSSDAVKVGVSSGDYVISLGSTAECTGTAYSDSSYSSVTISSTSTQYVILDDSNGALASNIYGCAPPFTASFPGTLEADGDASPSNSTDAIEAVGSGTLTLSESCSSDVSLGSGVTTVVVAGETSNDTLDLSGAIGPLSIDAASSPGTVTGFTSGHVNTVDFTDEQHFIGSDSGANTFQAPSSSNATFTGEGPGNGNTLDLSALSAPTVNVSGTPVGSTANDTVTAGSVTDTFSGMTAFKGSSTGSSTFYASSAGGLSFTGQSIGNELNLADMSGSPAVTIDTTPTPGKVTIGSATDSISGITSFVGASTGNTTFKAGNPNGLSFTGLSTGNELDLSSATSGVLIDASKDTASGTGGTDAFSGISTFVGSNSGGTTFTAGSSSGTFDAGGANNTLDLSNLSSPTVNVTGGTADGAANDTVTAGSVTDTFSGITTFDGPSASATTFLAGNTAGFTFSGQGGSTLDLSAVTSTGSSINASNDTASTSGGTDEFAGISKFIGSGSGDATLVAGPGPATFTGEGNGNTFVAGSGNDTFTGTGNGNTLDLSALSAPTVNLSGTPVGSTANDTVTAGSVTDTFSGVSTFKGSSTGGSTFYPGDAGGLSFAGQGNNNKLNLSELSGSPAVTFDTTTTPGSVSFEGATDSFSGITSFVGPTTGNTTFKAGNANGLSFTGLGTDNTLDLSSASSGVSVDASKGTASVAGGTDAFSEISNFIGSSNGGNAFTAGSNSATFDAGGTNNTLDLSNLSSPTVNVTGGPADAMANDTAKAGSVTDTFSGITAFGGSSASPTDFLAGNAAGFTFAGEDTGSTLDLSAATSGASINADMGKASTSGGTDDFTGISKFVGSSAGGNTFAAGSGDATFTSAGNGNTLDLSALSAPTVNVTGTTVGPTANDSVTAGSVTDTFSDVTAFKGSSTGGTSFLAGNTGGLNFTGQGTGNKLDLSAMSGFASLTVAMSGGSCASGTVTTSSSLTDCFAGIDTVAGSDGVPTTFQPDASLTSTPSPPVEFVGEDASSGGSVLDLSNFKSPVSDLKLSLAGNSPSSPGQVTGTVNGTAVTFAKFATINKAIGSSTLTTSFDPGTANGVQLVNITPAPQTIAFTSTPPSSATVGGSYVPQATGGGSGNPVALSLDPSSGGACSLTNGTVSFTGPGTCRIDANQAGNSEYQGAPQAQQSITVTQPSTPAPQPASPSEPGPSGSSEPSPSGSSPPTTHQVLVELTSDATSSTKAKLGAVLKAGGFTFKFKAPEAGTGTIDWYQSSKHKPVLVAAGKVTFAGAGTRAIHLKLTSAGRRLLRHTTRIKLTDKATFAAPGRATVTTTRSFRLARS